MQKSLTNVAEETVGRVVSYVSKAERGQDRVEEELRLLEGKAAKMSVLVNQWSKMRASLVEKSATLNNFDAWTTRIAGELREIEGILEGVNAEGRGAKRDT